jgi:hypothetical protein
MTDLDTNLDSERAMAYPIKPKTSRAPLSAVVNPPSLVGSKAGALNR